MIDGEDLERVLQELTQALYDHEQWHEELTRTIICRLPHAPRDVADDAHRHCRFGQWCYGSGASDLHAHAVFAAMESEHKLLHRLAAELLSAAAGGSWIAPKAYDDFANAINRLHVQIHALKRELEGSLARLDSLTGAESRIAMLSKLGEMRALGERRCQPCCIALMDVDHFKRINDAHGHLVGDQVLRACVHRLRENLRPYDHVFRYGGEEFLIVIPDTDLETGWHAIERIRERMAAAPLAQAGRKAIFATASFGVAMVDPDASIEESMDRADKMMYAAKRAGRNCVRVWRSDGVTDSP